MLTANRHKIVLHNFHHQTISIINSKPRRTPSLIISVINKNNSGPCTDIPYIIFVSDLNAAFRGEFYLLTGWTSPAPSLHVPEGSMMVIWRPKHVEDDMEVSVLVVERDHLEKLVALKREAHKMDWYL
jgi:hypothetical protein